ncbi:MAG: malto-oligosyltrehalose trehalohydrolase [Chryseolinea sp.]
MNKIHPNRRSIGINFSSRGESEVMVWAPAATEVSIILSETDVRVKLEKQEDGYFSCITAKLKPGDRYVFELAEGKRYPDPASQYQPEGVAGPSEVFNANHYHWKDQQWKNLPLSDYIFYELHTGAFTPTGTFDAIIDRLNYLSQLGITAIELMPVAEFSGERNWGYDGVFPFAVHHSYGGPLGLQRLVDACHEYGIAVVLDVVYNHLGPEGNNLEQFGPYFTDKYKTPWGSAINFDDNGSDEVRKFFIENALMWFRDFHIDGLRLDAVHAIRDFGATHILSAIRSHVDMISKETGRPYYLIAECDLNDPKYLQGVGDGGYGMDAQWIDEFHHSLRVTAGNERIGYYEDFDGLLHLAKSFMDAYVYDGIYSHHREKTFGRKASGLGGEKFVVFSQNHDQVGNRMLGERTSKLVSFEMQKVMAAAVLISPYLPMLFMGEEYGETNPFLYFVNHSDADLIAAVRNGRKKEFEYFNRGEEVPDPQSIETFNTSKLQWDLHRSGNHKAMLDYYSKLIALRKQLKSLRNGTRNEMEVKVLNDEQVLVVNRWHNNSRIAGFLNFSPQPREFVSPTSLDGMKMILNSTSVEWSGPETISKAVQGNVLVMPAESFILFSNDNV